MLYVILILSIILNAGFIIAIPRVKKKIDSYDDFFEQMQTTLIGTIDAMKSIDIRGSFQSDDEVGDTFRQLKGMVDALDVFIVTQRDDK